MSPLPLIPDPPSESFPRVSGDEPYTWIPAARFDGFSPRERG